MLRANDGWVAPEVPLKCTSVERDYGRGALVSLLAVGHGQNVSISDTRCSVKNNERAVARPREHWGVLNKPLKIVRRPRHWCWNWGGYLFQKLKTNIRNPLDCLDWNKKTLCTFNLTVILLFHVITHKSPIANQKTDLLAMRARH